MTRALRLAVATAVVAAPLAATAASAVTQCSTTYAYEVNTVVGVCVTADRSGVDYGCGGRILGAVFLCA